METNLKLEPDKICRTCLCESTNLKPLSTQLDGEEKTLLDVLKFVANFNFKTGEKLPKQVCKGCEEIMCKADAFKRRCLEAETILNNQINSDYFEVEVSLKSDIKHEISTELDVSNINQDNLASTSLVTPSNTNIFVENGLTQDQENLNIFKQFDLSDENTQNEKADIVKEEAENDFDSQNDALNDYDDPNTFETVPIELKPENAVSEVKVYSCGCGTIYNKKEEYRTHLKTKKCYGYKKSMNFKLVNKKMGIRNIMIKRRIICPECNLEFDTVKACKIHERTHKSEEVGLFECSLCMRKFSRKSSYTNHMKHHTEKANIKYKCETCKREFQHKAHLDNHILAVHTRAKGFMCDQCLTNFSTQESLDIHKESHKVEKKHQCSMCSKAFIMLSTLNDHIKTHTGEKPFLCSICGKGFTQKTNLAQHMRRHQGLKPFKCEECDRRFVSKGELVAHTRKHSGAHPFVCDDCGSGFTTSSSLVKHRRIHTGERPYACDLCTMRFAASGTLKNHRRTHTGEKPFQCSYCEKAFVQRHDLISHIRCHTGERPFMCGCGSAFRKASALKAHVKMHGKEPASCLTRQGVGLLIGVCDSSEPNRAVHPST